LIVCGHSKILSQGDGVKIDIGGKISNSLGLFTGQILFGDFNAATKRVFLSPLRLNPHVSYFRIFLEDVRGSLSHITEFFSGKGINILSGGAFGLGNLWISEFVADFKNVNETPETIVSDIEGIGGFVTSREITELFPRAFELTESYRIESNAKGALFLPLDNIPIKDANYAVLKAWPQVQTLFLDLYSPDNKLMKISAKIKDVPGSLSNLVRVLKNQVNLVAIDERHHDEVSGEWTIYGILEIGGIDELEERAKNTSSIISFSITSLGW
jgi:hypothetical protein